MNKRKAQIPLAGLHCTIAVMTDVEQSFMSAFKCYEYFLIDVVVTIT